MEKRGNSGDKMSADIGIEVKKTLKGIKLSQFCLSSGDRFREIKWFKTADEALKWLEKNDCSDYEGIVIEGFK